MEYDDLISIAMDARYLLLSRWDCLIVDLGPDYQVIEEAIQLDLAPVPKDLQQHVQYASDIFGRCGSLHLVFFEKW